MWATPNLTLHQTSRFAITGTCSFYCWHFPRASPLHCFGRRHTSRDLTSRHIFDIKSLGCPNLILLPTTHDPLSRHSQNKPRIGRLRLASQPEMKAAEHLRITLFAPRFPLPRTFESFVFGAQKSGPGRWIRGRLSVVREVRKSW